MRIELFLRKQEEREDRKEGELVRTNLLTRQNPKSHAHAMISVNSVGAKPSTVSSPPAGSVSNVSNWRQDVRMPHGHASVRLAIQHDV